MWIEYLVGTLGIVLVFYLLVRIGSAAYFTSKQDYERKHNERPQQRPR